jgi:hypothetical protein
LVTIARTQPDMNAPRDLAAEALQSERLVNRTDSAVDGWDGRILLAQEGSLEGANNK